jgi:hypothetical protein
MTCTEAEKKQDLIEQCRYYNGETELPKSLPQEYALMWDYESVWVKCELEQNEMLTVFKEGIIEYHLETKRDDQTPLTLKALLFNRYLHWGGYAPIEEELKNFEVWYEEHYLQRDTNKARMLSCKKPMLSVPSSTPRRMVRERQKSLPMSSSTILEVRIRPPAGVTL